MAAGVVLAWPGVLVLLKPSLGPFALIGVTRRSWWVVFALVGLASIPFWGLWADYLAIVQNGNGSLVYSLQDVPVVAAPVVAWLGRSRETEAGGWYRRVMPPRAEERFDRSP